jgi:predicted RNA polymerase sigma factor
VFGTEVESLLRRLAQLSDTPIIALNHVVAVAMVDGAAAGLQRLETLANDKQRAEDHRLYTVRAHLLEMTGDAGAPLDAYRAAARRASNPAAAALPQSPRRPAG